MIRIAQCPFALGQGSLTLRHFFCVLLDDHCAVWDGYASNGIWTAPFDFPLNQSKNGRKGVALNKHTCRQVEGMTKYNGAIYFHPSVHLPYV